MFGPAGNFDEGHKLMKSLGTDVLLLEVGGNSSVSLFFLIAVLFLYDTLNKAAH